MGLLDPLYYAVSWVMVKFHALFTFLGMDTASGWTWGLSIVGLVVVIRILLIPLFVKQIKAQRGLQLIQPEIKKLQDKYKGDRERQSQELMKLYKETGTNPLSSCLPILMQAPFFFALFQVLNGVATNDPRGIFTDHPGLFDSAGRATLFGVAIADKFVGGDTATQAVTLVMIILMSLTTFITQRQIMVKNTSAAMANNPFAQQQKILLYVFPLMFAVFGINFPVGVLIYWLTTNLWTMGQQFYVIRRMPAPGSLAEANLEKRRAARAARRRPHPPASPGSTAPAPSTPGGSGPPASTPAAGGGSAVPGPPAPGGRPVRSQPVRKPRSKRSGTSPKKR